MEEYDDFAREQCALVGDFFYEEVLDCLRLKYMQINTDVLIVEYVK